VTSAVTTPPRPDGTIALPVRIRSQDGKSGGAGEVEYSRPSIGERLRKAGKLVLLGMVAVVVFLPIPLMHLVGVLGFLALLGLAIHRLRSREVVKGAHGRCPACGAEGSYYVGFGNQRMKFPLATSCPSCHIGLELDPV